MDLSKFSLNKSANAVLDDACTKLTDLFHRHHLIVVYKTAFYSFYLPVALAMHMVRRLLVQIALSG